jgi:hypothetical protein
MTTFNYLNDVSYHRRITRLDLVHHLLGNGKLQAVVQVTENMDARNALVLHLMNPDRFADRHKSDSYTFHQQVGPELTMVGIQFANHFYVPNPRQTACDLQYQLEFDEGLPLFRAHYPLDFTLEGERGKTPFVVEEQIFCPVNHPAVLRRVRVSNQRGLEGAEARLIATLVPNQALFPEAHFRTEEQIAVTGHFSEGDEFLALAAFSEIVGHSVAEFPGALDILGASSLASISSCDDEQYVRPKQGYTNYPLLPISPHLGPVLALEFDLGWLDPGEVSQVDLMYVIGTDETQVVKTVNELREVGLEHQRQETCRFWSSFSSLEFNDPRLNNLFRAAQSGLRASVSSRGRMNAGIWGYGAEWVRDSSLACVGAILSGQFELARAMLVHMLVDMVSPEGIAFGEGQFYDIQRAELDQNGELLHTIWTYWVHSRDESLLREHWDVICKLADFPLRPEFWVEEASMLRGERDVRERDYERHGLLPGFELAHQMWVSLGLTRAADIAIRMGEPERGAHWRERGEQIWEAVLYHPKFKLVENNYLMKRRLLDGSFQRFAKSRPYVHRPTEAPLTKMYPRSLNRSGALEPDASEAWPIAYGLVDPGSQLARRTLLRMEQLWNQEWDFGGYPLHNVESEPTKLGPWPMTFYIITQAAAEAGVDEVVRRNLDWYLNTKDGRGFMWWEYRDADPDLQIDHGVIPWLIYGEPLTLLVHNLLGYRPGPDTIIIQPHLLPEWKIVQARLRNGEHWLNLTIHHAGPTLARAEINGQPWDRRVRGALDFDIPAEDIDVELWLENTSEIP